MSLETQGSQGTLMDEMLLSYRFHDDFMGNCLGLVLRIHDNEAIIMG